MIPKRATCGHSWNDKYKFATRGRTLAKFTKSTWGLQRQTAQIYHQEADSCFNNYLILFSGVSVPKVAEFGTMEDE